LTGSRFLAERGWAVANVCLKGLQFSNDTAHLLELHLHFVNELISVQG